MGLSHNPHHLYRTLSQPAAMNVLEPAVTYHDLHVHWILDVRPEVPVPLAKHDAVEPGRKVSPRPRRIHTGRTHRSAKHSPNNTHAIVARTGGIGMTSSSRAIATRVIVLAVRNEMRFDSSASEGESETGELESTRATGDV